MSEIKRSALTIFASFSFPVLKHLTSQFFSYFGKKEENKFSVIIDQPDDSEYSGDVSTWRSRDSFDIFTSLATELSSHIEVAPGGFMYKSLKTEIKKEEKIQEPTLPKADHLRWTKDNLCR